MLYQCTLYSILYIRSFIYLLFISFSKQLNFVWGEKQNTHIPPPVGHMIDWRRAEVRDPIHSRTQMPSEFTSLRNDQCQKHFIIPFTHRVGWAGRKFKYRPMFNLFMIIFGFLVFSWMLLCHFTRFLHVRHAESWNDRNLTGLPKYKMESQFRLGKFRQILQNWLFLLNFLFATWGSEKHYT